MLSPTKHGSKPETAQMSINSALNQYILLYSYKRILHSHEKANFLLHTIICMATTDIGFLDNSAGKEFACNAGDPGSFLGWEDPLEKG